MFTVEELNKAKELAYINWESDGGIGFEFEGTWITNPFMEDTGRFEFVDFDEMCKHYGKKNVVDFIKKILSLDKNEIIKMILDGMEMYTIGRLKDQQVFLTVEELQGYIEQIRKVLD